RQLGDIGELLRNIGNATCRRCPGTAEISPASIDADRSPVSTHHARQDLQKRGLAGTVLPQYGTGLARPDLEGDLPENPVRPVTLIYVPQCERGCRHCALLRLTSSTAEARP